MYLCDEFNKLQNMAQIELRLSNKVQKETGRSEVMLRFFFTKHDFYAKTEVFINPDFFEYYVDRKKTVNPKRPIPDNKNTTTLDRAVKNGWAVRNSGIVVTSTRQIRTDEVVFHESQAKKLDEIKKAILSAYETADKENLTSDWLKEIIYNYNHPEVTTVPRVKSFFELAEEYIRKRQIADSHARVYRVLVRAVSRYEGYVRNTDRTRKDFRWDINTVTRSDIEDFSDYLRNEKQLSEEYPTLFKQIMEEYPAAIKGGKAHTKLEDRGENTIIKMRTRLKSLFLFFYEEGYTKNRPFDGVKIGTEKVGTPIYITIGERNKIADADLASIWETMPKEEQKKAKMPIKTLIEQRDIFVFQCLIGCRVGDLCKLTENHIHNGVLVYTPHKTKDEGEEAMQARVPLHPKAQALIEKYRGSDSGDRLFPCISPQRYNDALKVIFKMAGITRMVEVRNPLTGENELVPINTIASSHLARRTFIGNAYFKVQDPNLIGKMSGHVEGSEAFKRYRKIEDSTLKDVIDLIG